MISGMPLVRVGFASAALTLLAAAPAAAQQDETALLLAGRPDTEAARALAPPQAPAEATTADRLPTARLKAPRGFNVEVWASGIPNAGALRISDKGTVFVASASGPGRVYAVVDKAGRREVKQVLSGLAPVVGIETGKDGLFVAAGKEILRYADIDANLDAAPQPSRVSEDLPGDATLGGALRLGPDGKLYVAVGAACNACEPAHDQAQIRRMATDGSGSEIVAQGVRRSLGLDFNPANKDLYFTDNGREWMSEDVPADELNRLVRTGQHYGFPYCHQGDLRDSQFGWGRSCGEFVKPLALLGPHTDVGGIHFYTGTMFPRQYRNTLFIVRKGAWSRTSRLGADILVAQLAGDGSVEIIEPFLTGFLEKDGYAGRPSDVAMMKDGSLLVSDEANGAIYRISFAAAARPARPAHAPAARPARTSAPRPARPAATTRLPPPPPLPQQAR